MNRASWLKQAFEISRADKQNILSMEGIRGFAVFLVFLVHFASLVEPWISDASVTKMILNQFANVGKIGVDLFFVLSGYLIYGILIRKSQNYHFYIKRRIQRIYPTFTAVFAIYLLLSFIFPAESKIPDGLDGLIYILQNYLLLPGLFDIKAIITVAWTLSYEFFIIFLFL